MLIFEDLPTEISIVFVGVQSHVKPTISVVVECWLIAEEVVVGAAAVHIDFVVVVADAVGSVFVLFDFLLVAVEFGDA